MRFLPGLPASVSAFAAVSALASCATTPARHSPDIRGVAPDLAVPPLSPGVPAPGKRVKETHPDYAGTSVFHVTYLPTDWQPGRRYPVMVEYTGNGGFRNQRGDTCSGRVEDSKLGYGITGGEGYIWVCLPYLNGSGTANVTKWWGDKPGYRPDSTVDYAKKAVPWICAKYGGDPSRVILTGFSRGSIACNYIGLHDDGIARLWRAFIPYSVYDGTGTGWSYPDWQPSHAAERLKRLGSRPQFICDEISSPDSNVDLKSTREMFRRYGVTGNFTFCSTGFHNHDDAWVLRPSPARTRLRKWLDGVAGS